MTGSTLYDTMRLSLLSTMYKTNAIPTTFADARETYHETLNQKICSP